MIIIWKRNGLFVPFIVGVVLLVVVVIVDAITKDPEYCSRYYWPKALALVISAAIVWFAGRRMNRDVETVVTKDKKGKERKIRNSHSFYVIDVEYWAFAILALAVICYWI